MKRPVYTILAMALFFLSGAGCSTTKVTRVEVEEKVDLSGNWNDYDAMLVSKDLIADCLAARWLGNFEDNYHRKPVVIVGHVVNQSDEHINSEVVSKHLEKELLDSGKVVFVASPEERTGIRAERDDQQSGYTLNETIKAHGKERGADLMLIGSFNSVKDAVKGKSAVLYQVNLELVDISSNEKVWLGQAELKKTVKKSGFSL